MKNNTNKSKTIKKTLQKLLAMILILAIINQLAACSYYSVESIGWKNKEQTRNILLNYKVNNKYIIVDCGKDSYHVTDIVIDTVSMTINCHISPMDNLHPLYHPGTVSNQRYKTNQGEDMVLNEIHIVTNKFLTSKYPSSSVLPINSIVRIDIIHPDTGRTIASYVGCILIPIGGLFIIFLIILAIELSMHPII
jgi:hypothetical protein